MKKFYRIILLLIVFTILSTYYPLKTTIIAETSNKFFNIKNIIIINNFLIKKNEINEKLNHIYSKNIFFLDRKDVEKPLKKINFLEKIEVKKKYPNAILYKNKIRHLLDSSSNLIFIDDNMYLNELPNIFGEGAENNFIFLFNQLENNNFPIKKIKNFYYFQIGRWDLQLFNEKIIKLPNNNTKSAIRKSIELLDRKDFENYKIIDLRVEGKIIVE